MNFLPWISLSDIYYLSTYSLYIFSLIFYREGLNSNDTSLSYVTYFNKSLWTLRVKTVIYIQSNTKIPSFMWRRKLPCLLNYTLVMCCSLWSREHSTEKKSGFLQRARNLKLTEEIHRFVKKWHVADSFDNYD